MSEKQHLLDLAMSLYVGEPCRICGKNITQGDLQSIVWAGSSADFKARSAHEDCWKNNKDKKSWAHQ